MPLVTIIYGILLIVLGATGYLNSDGASITALIPAFFGIVFLGLGLLARQESLLKHAMHGAAVLALLAVGGAARGLLQLPALLSGAEILRPQAVIAQSIMAVLSIIFLALCIRSFVEQRQARKRA